MKFQLPWTELWWIFGEVQIFLDLPGSILLSSCCSQDPTLERQCPDSSLQYLDRIVQRQLFRTEMFKTEIQASWNNPHESSPQTK